MRFRHHGLTVFSPAQFDQRVQAGLVGQWIGQGSGLTKQDYSGRNNHLTLLGGPTWSLGRGHRSSVVNFDAVDDRLDSATTAAGDSLSAFGSNITVACSVFATTDTGLAQMFVTKPVASAAHTDPYFAYSLHCIGGGANQYVRFAIDTTGAPGFTEALNCVISPVGSMKYNEWLHIAGTYDGANMRLYLNGILINTAAHVGNLFERATPLRLGANGAVGELLGGRLDNVRVYNRTLSSAEIALLAAPDFRRIIATSHRNLALDSQLGHPRYGDFNMSGF